LGAFFVFWRLKQPELTQKTVKLVHSFAFGASYFNLLLTFLAASK